MAKQNKILLDDEWNKKIEKAINNAKKSSKNTKKKVKVKRGR